MKIQVNLTRALERITHRTATKKPVYGLFIDFSNPYKNVPHTLLFQEFRAKKIMKKDQIEFFERCIQTVEQRSNQLMRGEICGKRW